MQVSTPTNADIGELVEAEPATRVSIYLPTHRTGRETRQDPIRLKNLLKVADAQLEQRGHDVRMRRELLAPASEIPEDVTSDFWRNGSDSLVLLLGPDVHRCHKLPIDAPEAAFVSDHFFLNPLLKYLQGDGRYFVLAISQNRARLFSGTKHGLSAVELATLPDNLRDALRIDERVSTLQFHSQQRRGAQPGGEAIFHGQGAGDEADQKTELLQYFHRVDEALTPYLHQHNAPLVFVGVEHLFPIFQQACSYAGLLDEAVTGNPDELSEKDLHPATWPIVEPRFQQAREVAIEKHGVAASRGKATEDLEQICSAAKEGRVETLLVIDRVAEHLDASAEGSRDAEAAGWLADNAFEALSRACVWTLGRGGQVFLLCESELPTERQATATLRY